MFKRILMLVLSTALFCSCSGSADDGHSDVKKPDKENISEAQYVSYLDMLSDFDEAFEQSYTKFKLPENESVKILQPTGIYNLEIQSLGADLTEEWLTTTAEKLAENLGIFDEYEIVSEEWEQSILENNICTSLDILTRVYTIWNDNDDIENPNSFESVEHIYINRLQNDDMPSALVTGIEYFDSLSEKCCATTGDALQYAKCYKAIHYTFKENEWYRIDLQKSFEGIPIRNMICSKGDKLESRKDEVVSQYFNPYAILAEDGKPIVLSVSDSYKVLSKEPIDKVISFKSACDLLEKELAPEIDLKFSDVELMYEPVITKTNGTKQGTEVVKCTPKWYFMIDNPDDYGYAMYYISVDCATGKITVNI